MIIRNWQDKDFFNILIFQNLVTLRSSSAPLHYTTTYHFDCHQSIPKTTR